MGCCLLSSSDSNRVVYSMDFQTKIQPEVASLLEVSKISKSFGSFPVLKDTTFKCAESDVLGIIGPNGSGKTTLLNIISGFITADSGEVLIQGKRIDSFPPYRRFRTGLFRTFQENRLAGELTLKDHLLLSLNTSPSESVFSLIRPTKRQDNNRIESITPWLEYLDLTGYLKTPLKTLSYGQVKMSALLCGMVSKAEIFLLDEPFSGLSASLIEKTISFIKDHIQKNKAIIIVEHNLHALSLAANRILYMERGEQIVEVLPCEIKDNQIIYKSLIGRR